MKIFITGAAGYIGGSIAERLRSEGHAVRGLVRRDTQAEGLTARGITPVPGDLDDHALLMREARSADAVINAASSDHRASVVLGNSMIYGAGGGLHADSVQIPPLVAQAQRSGVVRIVGVTALYALALERAPAGAFYFVENGEASYAEIGAAIARRLGLGPVQAWSVEEATPVWGERYARYSFGSNSRVRALRARRELGWVPSHASVTEWIEREMFVR